MTMIVQNFDYTYIIARAAFHRSSVLLSGVSVLEKFQARSKSLHLDWMIQSGL